MLQFLPGSAAFFLAGLAAAAGPVLIHLLNRRRFQVVHWAAMDFLLEALKRNRRILHLRDLLLLALRTACLVLFGLALAQPLWVSGGKRGGDGSQPVHAVVIVDNSLSMGYERLDGTLLAEAKSRAKELLDRLPEGSRISVLPLCGEPGAASRDAYHTRQDARDAVERIELADRAGTAAQAVDLARQAARQLPQWEQRVTFFGDQQIATWPRDPTLGQALGQIPEMQVISLAPAGAENSWVESLTLEDGIADAQSETVLTAVVRHEGPSARPRVPVTLSVGGVDVDAQTVDLEPGQSREVTFRHKFDVQPEPGKALFVPAAVSLPADRLATDDSRYLAVPVVAALPVVFVDQYGQDEDPKRLRYGETRHLRRLLAPLTSRGDAARQLVAVEHRRIEQVNRELLQSARLVVIAGVHSPEPPGGGESVVALLREYVEQGGQLMICAGGDFEAPAWNQAAWRDGAGVLPLPLKGEPLGRLPDESAEELRPFFLSFASMSHDLFQLADASREELEDLYGLPLFFKAVEADASADRSRAALAAETQRWQGRRETLAGIDRKLAAWAEQEARGTLADADRRQRDELLEQRGRLQPRWLNWADADADSDDALASAAQLADRGRPRVLAAFDNGRPFLVERGLGRGSVLLVTSGVFSDWNNLPKTNAVLVFDRILRGMLERTLPRRNVATGAPVVLPVTDRALEYQLTRPGGQTEPLAVEALGADRYGVALRGAAQRGVYKVAAAKPGQQRPDAAPEPIWDTALAFNGPASESEPAYLDESTLRERTGDAPIGWVGRGQPISLQGARVRGQDLWKWLLGAVLALLLVEMAVLARPFAAREPTP